VSRITFVRMGRSARGTYVYAYMDATLFEFRYRTHPFYAVPHAARRIAMAGDPRRG
jgi:hypothetical protein